MKGALRENPNSVQPFNLHVHPRDTVADLARAAIVLSAHMKNEDLKARLGKPKTSFKPFNLHVTLWM